MNDYYTMSDFTKAINTKTTREMLMSILGERKRQNEKWGEQNHDDYRWLAILTEEVGELSQAILHDEFGGKATGTMRDELIQVTAVAFQWIEALERRETAVTQGHRGKLD